MSSLLSSPVSGLLGTAKVPGDKSISHRALMLGTLAAGETVITGLLEGEDVLRTARALISMGAIMTPPDQSGGIWRVQGLGGKPLRAPRTTVYLGNSGTSTRLLMGLMGGYPIQATFTGDESLSRRPMGRVIKPLAQMGVQFETSSGDKLPLRVVGATTLRPIRYDMPVASAQVKSAILLAGLRAKGKTVVVETQPTRDHTERMLRYFGVPVDVEKTAAGENVVTLSPVDLLEARPISVPGDPSSAAFLTVAALITAKSDIVIPNVLVNPYRIGLYDTLREMGADITFENPREKGGEPVADIHVRSSRLKGVTVPPSRVPSMIDEFPILSIAAAFAEGETIMSGLDELKVKESDRLAAIAEGLSAAGVETDRGESSLTVTGSRHPRGGCTVKTHMDHRIAMSFLVMGLGAKEPITVDEDEMIKTSFPDFVNLMNGLGAAIRTP